MGTKALQADADAEGSSDADDFKRIPGIGPVIERHLHEAGVRSFAQLAALSPDQIAVLVAHLPLLSAERILRQDWAGRALALAREGGLRAAESGVPGQRATFTVEFMLDANSRVTRTRAVHLRDRAEAAWVGWSAERLVAFFGAHVPGLGTAITGDHPAMEPSSPLGTAELLLEVGELRVETEMQDELGAPRAGFDLRAQLPFALAGPAAAQLVADGSPYCVAILAVDPAGGATILIGAHHGRLRPDQQSYGPLIELAPPREGRFQLLGTVLIAQAGLVKSALGPVLHVVA